MNNLILVKLGGSVITDKSREFVACSKNIKKLAGEVKRAKKVFKGSIIIGHGAGSFAHTPAAKYQTKKGFISKGSINKGSINKKGLMGMSIVEDAARQLNAIVIKEFLSESLPVFPFSPASFMVSDIKGGVKSHIDAIKNALRVGAIPVVYGDVIMDKTQGCTIFSTEKILSVLAEDLKKDYRIRMIFVTDVDGVYDRDGKTIPVITSSNFDQLKTSIAGAKNTDVTGGMLHKVEESLKLAKDLEIRTLIVNGTRDGELEKSILGEKTEGTLVT